MGFEWFTVHRLEVSSDELAWSQRELPSGGGRAGGDPGVGVHSDDHRSGCRLGRDRGRSVGTTAVLAPTYISSGVGGKPTVQFSALNVQIVNGTTPAGRLGFLGRIRAGVREAGCLWGRGFRAPP